MSKPAGHRAYLLIAVFALAGCAGTMQSRSAEHARPKGADVYAAGDGSPVDIYRSWYLFKELDGNASVKGELRLADLTSWKQDQYRSAYYWYRRAAAGGDTIAAANLWYMYETRSESAGDNQEAMGYYQLAADSDAGQRQLFALETKLAIDNQRHRPSGSAGGQGMAIVEFDRTDGGKASDVKLYRSSGDADVDDAAIQAVKDADLPAVPAAMDGLRHFIISVRFTPDIG